MTQNTYNPFQQLSFQTSAASLSQCPTDHGREVAFAGRSNAGKSSAINIIAQQRKLAKTSKTPGRTQLLNFFTVQTPEHRVVDLPGYGYAKVPLATKREWEQSIDQYLRERNSLCGLFLIMDIRHPLTDFDQAILSWARSCSLPIHVLLTKADKFKFGAAKAVALKVAAQLRDHDQATVQLFSATASIGVEEARIKLANWLALENTKP